MRVCVLYIYIYIDLIEAILKGKKQTDLASPKKEERCGQSVVEILKTTTKLR